jgi:excisionase family DNA binding protein
VSERDSDVSDRLQTAKEIAEFLSVPESWVQEQARAGNIPHYRLGRYVRFRVEEILAWLDECRTAGRPARLRRYGSRTDNSPRTEQTAGGVTPKE